MTGDETADFEKLRKVVEAILEVADEEQVKAPRKEEVAEKLGVSELVVSEWTDWDFNQPVRAAGLVPRNNLNIGDYMAVYDKLDDSGREITQEVII